MANWIGIALLFVLPFVTAAAGTPCADIDSKACGMMHAESADFCKDPVLAPTACKKYCNLCPPQCYHCNTTVTDFHMCTTLTQCGDGEMCMRKQLKSTLDGHEEYQLTCESKQTCDGFGLVIPFGKRGVESRDISISCCGTDGCNYPTSTTTTTTTATTTTTTTTATTTTTPRQTTLPTSTHAHHTQSTGCKKDVIVIIDESNSMVPYNTDVKHFLSSVVSRLHIGSDGVLVSVATFADSSRKRWDLNAHTSNTSLQSTISSHLHFRGGSGDLNAAIDYAVANTRPGIDGNRADAPDVVIIITDDTAKNSLHETIAERQLHNNADSVIAIAIGLHLSPSEVFHLASDTHHAFFGGSAQKLYTLSSTVAKLIC